jgi:FdhD protein
MKKSKIGEAIATLPVRRYRHEAFVADQDQLTVEEPIELLIEYGGVANRKRQRISVNLYTPGQEEEWALGFLFAEGMIGSAEQVLGF